MFVNTFLENGKSRAKKELLGVNVLCECILQHLLYGSLYDNLLFLNEFFNDVIYMERDTFRIYKYLKRTQQCNPTND